MKSRLKRLLIPYILWPIIFLVFNNITFKLYNKSRFQTCLPLEKLLKQIIIGRIYCIELWFLFNLIFFTIIFFILSKLLEINNFLKLVQIIAILSYFFQYSEYNYIFFDKYKDSISHSLGHFVESFPISASAFILNNTQLLKYFKISRYTTISYCFIIIFFICKYNIFRNIEIYGITYSYNGLEKIFFSFSIFVFFYLIPFEKIKSKKIF